MPQSAAQHIELHPLTLRALVNTSTVNPDARTAEVIFSTGAPVQRADWLTGHRYVETLSLKPSDVQLRRLNDSAPLLNSHDGLSLSGQIGVVESARISDGKGIALVRFSKRPDVEPIFQDVKDGIVRNVSVGYRVHKYEQTDGGAGEPTKRHAVDWEPYEISVVPMGADNGAKIRDARAVETNPCEIVTRSAGHEERPMNEHETTPPPAEPVAPPVATATIDPDAVRAATDAERERGLGIRLAVRAGRSAFDDIKAADAFAEDLIRKNVTLDKARSLVLEKLATQSDATASNGHYSEEVRLTGDERDRFREGAVAWILTKAGVAGRVIEAAKLRGETIKIEPGDFRGMTLRDLARASLERNGVKTRGMDSMRMVGEALTHRVEGGYSGTPDFPVLLEVALNKTLLAAYGTTPDTWQQIATVGSVSDFRPYNRYRQGSFGRLDLVNEAGEFRNKPIPDGLKEVISATTKGNIIGITRQAIINDDMGAFSSLATRLGRAAKLSIEMDVYDLIGLAAGLGPVMSDGLTLFHATHLNIGTGSVLGVAGLDADSTLMATQRDPSNNEILDLRPSVLLLPIGLGGAAKVLNAMEFEPLANVFQKPNIVRGLFSTIVATPRLTGTRRYLFASPDVAPTFEVVFLDGNREPFLDMQDGWRIDGTEWKVRLDYGLAAVDFRAAVTNAGV
jgi:HK97 family phage prohead protease